MVNEKEIRDKLIQYIRDNPTSLNVLAIKIGIAFDTIMRIVDGKENVRQHTWLKVDKYLRDNTKG